MRSAKFGNRFGWTQVPGFWRQLADSLISKWLLQRNDSVQIAMTCQDFKAMEIAVQMGSGIGILPTRFMRTDDTLVQCFELPEDLGSTVWLLLNPSAYRRPEVKAFTAFFAPRYSALFRED
ncbi:LysR substrate-binding domain-containing protein [Octadecabacter antarcticus]|uniref:LysR substrate-binding domain-containing protein n=1 Tax=Octadecabacter antarcticus TaxID=1217908 RepID=UPI0009FF0994